MLSQGDLIWPVIFRSSLAMVIAFGLLGSAVGIGLLVSSTGTFRFLHAMNRWISLRSALRPLEIPHMVEPLAYRHRYSVGIALVLGGVFAAFGLTAGLTSGFDAAAFGATFVRGPQAVLLSIAAEASRWVLVAGSVAGVAVGVALCMSPAALTRFERIANHWISPRQMLRDGDRMRPSLDKLVEAHPWRSGWVLTCTGIGVVAYAAFLLSIRS